MNKVSLYALDISLFNFSPFINTTPLPSAEVTNAELYILCGKLGPENY